MGTVVALPGARKAADDPTPDPEVIAALEQFLADAKSGNLQAFAIAGVRVGGMTTTGWELGGGPNRHLLMAAISYLQARFAREADETSDPAYVS